MMIRPRIHRRPEWRRVLVWLVPAVLLPVVATGAVSAAGRAVPLDDTQTWLPRAPATTWVYARSIDGEPTGFVVDRVVGRAALGRQTADVIERRTEGLEEPLTSRRNLYADDGVIVEHGVRHLGTYLVNDPPMPRVLDGASAGRSHTWTGKQGGVQGTATLTVVEVEDIRVRGRQYRSCSHQQRVIELGGDAPSTTTVDAWLCPRIGPVLSRERLTQGETEKETLLELIGFHSPGTSFRMAPAELSTATPSRVEPETGSTATVRPGPVELDRVLWTDRRLVAPAHAPVPVGTSLVVADEDAVLTSTDARTGSIVWTARVTPPVVHQPVASGSVVLVADGSKSLVALDAATGATRWTASFPDVLSGPPVVAGALVVVAVENRDVVAVHLADGTREWSKKRPELISGMATDGRRVYVADVDGGVAALAQESGEETWSATLDGALVGAPVVADGTVVVADDQGNVEARVATTGDLRWQTYRERQVTQQPTVAGGSVALVLGRHLESVDLRTGGVDWSSDSVETSVPPVALGSQLALLDPSGVLYLYDRRSGEALATRDVGEDLAGVQPGSIADVPLVVTHDSLVVTVRHRLPNGVSYIALPWGPGGTHVGARLVLEATSTLEEEPLMPPVGAPGSFAYLGAAGTVWTVTHGEVRPVPGVEGSSVAVPAGDLVLVTSGPELQAVDRSTGSQRWREPVGKLPFGTQPAVRGDIAVVASPTVGLRALDVRDGQDRWHRDVPAGEGPGMTPLVLADGDVVHAEGVLARYSAEAEDPLWVLDRPGLVAPPVTDGAAVFVVGFDSENTGYLAAVDPRSGQILWQAPFEPAVAHQPPAVHDGVVVAADASLQLHAWESSTGRPLWTVPMSSGISGSPVIVGRSVVVDELGHPEDLRTTGHRVVAYDLRTGRFLAAHQVIGIALSPWSFGSLDGGTLAVPGADTTGPILQQLRLER